MVRLGFSYEPTRKGYYVDGHGHKKNGIQGTTYDVSFLLGI
jgi:hypothetical protein